MSELIHNPPAGGRGLISTFVRHPVACNLLMVIMILAGLWGLFKLNTQFFPSFDIDYVRVSIAWEGASAEDIESGITDIVEDRMRSIAGRADDKFGPDAAAKKRAAAAAAVATTGKEASASPAPTVADENAVMNAQ